MKKILSPKIKGSGPARLADKLRSLVADDMEIAALDGQIAIYEAWALDDGARVKVQVELRLPDQSYRMLTRVVSFPLPPEMKVSYRDWTIVAMPNCFAPAMSDSRLSPTIHASRGDTASAPSAWR